MNQEKKLQWVEASKVLWVVAFALLYSFGGIEHKFLRRFIAPLILCFGMFVYSKDWKCFMQAPFMMLTLCMGYGASTLLDKIAKRACFGLANGVTSFLHGTLAILSEWSNPGNFLLLILHVLGVMFICVVSGAFNPFHSARAEEFVIGFAIGFIPMMFTPIKRKGD